MMSCLKLLQRNKALNITCDVEDKTFNWTAVVKKTGQVVTLTECPQKYRSCQGTNHCDAIAYNEMNRPILHFDKVTSKLLGLEKFRCRIQNTEYQAEGCTHFEFADDGHEPSAIIAAAVAAVGCTLIFMLVIYIYIKVKRDAGDQLESDDKFREDLQEAGPEVESVMTGSTLLADAAPTESLTPRITLQADVAPSKNLTPDQLMYLENIIHFQGRLTPERREDLAKELNVDERAIKQWVRMTRDDPFFY